MRRKEFTQSEQVLSGIENAYWEGLTPHDLATIIIMERPGERTKRAVSELVRQNRAAKRELALLRNR